MFGDCQALTSLDLSGFDTSSVTRMSYMFNNCQALTSLDLSGFDTSSVTDMSYMFMDCQALTSLDLSGFDTSSVTSKNFMFSGCGDLRLITISDKMSNVLAAFPDRQYYPAAGGSPVAKADLTAGTWVRDEADLTKVTSIVQQEQMSQAISRRIGGVRRDLEVTKRHVDGLASVNLGKLILAGNNILCWIGQYIDGGMPEPGINFDCSVVSQDLHVIKQPYIGMKNDTEQPIVTIGLSGSVDITTDESNTCEFFTYEFSCSPMFETDGTIQKPVMAMGCTSSGSCIYFGYANFNNLSGISLVKGTLWTTGANASPSPSDITKLLFYS